MNEGGKDGRMDGWIEKPCHKYHTAINYDHVAMERFEKTPSPIPRHFANNALTMIGSLQP